MNGRLKPNPKRAELLADCFEAREHYLARDDVDPQVAAYATQALLSEALGERVQEMTHGERVPLERMLYGLALYKGSPRVITLLRALIAQPRYVTEGALRGLRLTSSS